MQYRTPEQVTEEVADMWAEWEWLNSDGPLRTYLRKAYRGEPLPEEDARFLRNDPVADWLELRA